MPPKAPPTAFDEAALLAAVEELGAALGELRDEVRRREARPRATQRAAIRDKARTGMLKPARMAAATAPINAPPPLEEPMPPQAAAIPDGPPLVDDWVSLTQLAGVDRPADPRL